MQNEELRLSQVYLEESRSKYADLYDFAPVGYLTLDGQDRIVEANLTAATLLGTERSKLLGRVYAHFLADADRGDFRQLLGNGLNHQEQRGEFLLKNGNGGLRVMLLDILFLKDAEGLERRRIAMTDITELKRVQESIMEHEEQLSTIYENAPLIMLLLDGERRVCKANKMAEECAIHGGGAADLIGRRGGEALRCLHALDDPEGCGFGSHCLTCTVRRTIINTLETGHSHHQVEASLPFLRDGKHQTITFLISTARLFVQGQPQVLITIQDITKRKETREALRQSEENLHLLATQLLTAQERERIRIAHELHDDLGQSLMLLKLQLSRLARDLPPELQNPRQQCFDSVDNVQEVIDSVHRLSHDLIPPTLIKIGLKPALNGLLDEFSSHHNITCVADFDEIKGFFSLDTELNIYRILQESLTNVGKYSQATQVSVSIKRKGHQVWFSVEDNGKGFEVDQIQTRQGRKRGLGLASMEERARMMGGTFHLWSKPEAGTKIHITVPLST